MLKLINPIEETKKAIPELEKICNYGNVKTVSDSAYRGRMKTIETKNLRKYHRSTSWVSLYAYFSPCVLELDPSYHTVTINEAKYQLIRKYVMSESFNV